MSGYLELSYYAMFACRPDLYAIARISNSRWPNARATNTIDYVASNVADTTTSTRTVIVELPTVEAPRTHALGSIVGS